MFQVVLLSQLLLAKEQEGVKLCGEDKISSGFTGHRLRSRPWAKLEPGGCAIPGREEIWPRSSTATVCCVILNHILTSLCSVEPWRSYEGSCGLGMAILSTSNQESRS